MTGFDFRIKTMWSYLLVLWCAVGTVALCPTSPLVSTLYMRHHGRRRRHPDRCRFCPVDTVVSTADFLCRCWWNDISGRDGRRHGVVSGGLSMSLSLSLSLSVVPRLNGFLVGDAGDGEGSEHHVSRLNRRRSNSSFQLNARLDDNQDNGDDGEEPTNQTRENPANSTGTVVSTDITQNTASAPTQANGNNDGEEPINQIRENHDDVADSTSVVDTDITQNPTPAVFVEDSPTGIGGRGGITYDVNKLKRNLVQEAVRQYKIDLLNLLNSAASDVAGEDNDDQQQRTKGSISTTIQEKIAGLVEANPVSTTTDSNLLQGRWDFTFLADNASTILSGTAGAAVVGSTLVLGRGVEYQENLVAEENFWKSGPWRADGQNGVGSKMDDPSRSSTRFFNLEDLEYEEDPYVVDTMQYYNGLWTVERRYNVVGLTRTTLELKLDEITLKFCGKIIRRKGSKGQGTVNIKFFYLDSNLCIASMLSREKDNLLVYTKGTEVQRNKQKRRLLYATLSYLINYESPLQIRRTISKIIGFHALRQIFANNNNNKYNNDNSDDNNDRTIIENSRIRFHRKNAKTDESLTVWRLGALDSDGGSGEESPAWAGEEDPFGDLDPVERQEIMKRMSMEEITSAGEAQRKKVRARKMKEYSKMQQFKRPNA